MPLTKSDASSLRIISVPGCGRGVATSRALRAGDLIERAPVIVLSTAELARVCSTSLARYYFEWGADDEQGAIALGYGSLYNHSHSANAFYEFRESELAIEFFAARDIEAGEELTVNYNNTGELADLPRSFD